MWKVLGVEAVIPRMADVFEERLTELSKRRKDKQRFLDMMGDADLRYVFDPMREVNIFTFQLPSRYGPEDLEFMRAFVLKLVKASKDPVVEYEGQPQKCAIVISSEEERDEYHFRKEHRTEILQVMESAAERRKQEAGGEPS